MSLLIHFRGFLGEQNKTPPDVEKMKYYFTYYHGLWELVSSFSSISIARLSPCLWLRRSTRAGSILSLPGNFCSSGMRPWDAGEETAAFRMMTPCQGHCGVGTCPCSLWSWAGGPCSMLFLELMLNASSSPSFPASSVGTVQICCFSWG